MQNITVYVLFAGDDDSCENALKGLSNFNRRLSHNSVTKQILIHIIFVLLLLNVWYKRYK